MATLYYLEYGAGRWEKIDLDSVIRRRFDTAADFDWAARWGALARRREGTINSRRQHPTRRHPSSAGYSSEGIAEALGGGGHPLQAPLLDLAVLPRSNSNAVI